MEVLSGQHAGAAGAADRRVHKGVGKGRASIREECFGLVQRLADIFDSGRVLFTKVIHLL